MTGALLDRPGSLLADDRRPASHRGPLGGGQLTLEERLDATLHAAREDGGAECPVCDERMTPGPHGAACGSCGSRLS